jgi:hypothetical protein
VYNIRASHPIVTVPQRLLSYSYDGDIISPDPIHAPGDSDKPAWASFLQAFNDWAHRRGSGPLLW